MSFDAKPFHEAYCQLTGLQLRYDGFHHERCWFEFSQAFTLDDLRLVIAYVKKLYRGEEKANIRKGCLRFSHLVERTDRFGEYLAEARAVNRVKPPTPRERILAATGRHPVDPEAWATPEEIMARDQFLKLLAQSRKEA